MVLTCPSEKEMHGMRPGNTILNGRTLVYVELVCVEENTGVGGASGLEPQ